MKMVEDGSNSDPQLDMLYWRLVSRKCIRKHCWAQLIGLFDRWLLLVARD